MSKLCRFYSRLGRFTSKRPIDIISVGKSKFPEAVSFIEQNFLDDPFVRAMGISLRHKETKNFLSKLWLTLLRSELSLAAVHRRKICALCINCSQTQQETDSPNKDDTFLQLAKRVKTEATRNLLRAWDKINREALLPFGKTDDDRKIKILELAGCTVEHNYRRLGIAKKLIQSSADMAMLLGFDYIRIDCTHMATAKICNQLGWQKIWEMPFEAFDGVYNNTYASLDEKENATVKVYIKPVHSNLRKI